MSNCKNKNEERSYHVDGVFGVFVGSGFSMLGFGLFWLGPTMLMYSISNYGGITMVIVSSMLVFCTTMMTIMIEAFEAKATRHAIYSLVRVSVVFLALGVKSELLISVPYVILCLFVVYAYHLGSDGKIVWDKGQYMA